MQSRARAVARLTGIGGVALLVTGCMGANQRDSSGTTAPGQVRPGITVLLDDSIHLVSGKRIALVTNQSGIDESGRSSVDLLHGDRARAAGVTLVRLFSPEHGIRGTEDRTGIADEIDRRTGLLVVSLYTNTTTPPPDSLLRDIDALVVDLQDIGTRTWTYVGVMLYSMQSTARAGIPIIVLDRPNPISGLGVSGPLLDTALANPDPPSPTRPGRAYALHPTPLRHGLTMGEMAHYFNHELGIGASLNVVPVAGWRRSMWYGETGLPWVKPSPNMPDVTSALIYPSLVAFEGSNVSVGRGTEDAFQRFGAPWLDAERVAQLLANRGIPGVRFLVDSFTPRAPTDGKYPDRRIPGIKIEVVDRDLVPSGLLGASVLWALAATHPDSLRITAATFDLRFGSSSAREALLRGADPGEVMSAQQEAVDAYLRATEPHRIYR